MKRRDAFWAWVFADENRRYWSIAVTIFVAVAVLSTLFNIWFRFD